MKSNLNQILEINLLAMLHLETPDFIRPVIGHVIYIKISKISYNCKIRLLVREHSLLKKKNGIIDIGYAVKF